MSPQEFENYLALLTRLLRIEPKQRNQVASEFRSHLEDRLDELLARGVPRETAIQTALEEFGDAAALAAEYVALSRNRTRRLIMRLTTASVAATVLIAAAIFTFWPGTNAGPGPAATIAQDPFGGPPAAAAPAAPAGPTDPVGGGESTLDEKLNKRIDAEFIETPLKDVLAYLHDTTRISFYLKTKRLDEAGVSTDAAVSLSLKQLRVSTLLDLMLEELGLVYTQKDDLVVITTAEDADATMEVRVYDCRDLIAMSSQRGRAAGMPGMEMMPGGGPPGYDSGYSGGSSGYPATPRAGYDSGSGYPGSAAPPARGSATPRPALPAVPNSPDAGGEALPGSAAPPARQGSGRTPARAPRPPAAGADPFSPGVPEAVPPASGDEVLPQNAGMAMPGSSGMSGMPGMPGGMGGGFGPGDSRPQRPLTEQDLKAEQLMDIITTAVDPATWIDQGGPGTIGQYNGLIVVSQSARTHAKIEKVLGMLREAAGRPQSPKNPVVR
jgi:hypothetical protein